MWGIYRIFNVVTEHFYVGSSKNLRRRRWEHWDALKKGQHHCTALQAAWHEFGEDAFEFEVLENLPEGSDLVVIEETYLMKHAGAAYCYNTSPSAHLSCGLLESVQLKISQSLKDYYASDPDPHPRRGKHHSAESKSQISRKVQRALAEGRGGRFIPTEATRLKMSEALKGNQCAKGHVRTLEHRQKLAAAAKGNKNFLGRKHTPEALDKMRRPVLETTTNTRFNSLSEVLTVYGLKMPTLRRALASGRPIAKGPRAGLAFIYL